MPQPTGFWNGRATGESDNPIPGPSSPYLSHSHPQVSQSLRYGCDSGFYEHRYLQEGLA